MTDIFQLKQRLLSHYDVGDEEVDELIDDYYVQLLLEEEEMSVDEIASEIAILHDLDSKEEVPELDVPPNRWELLESVGGPGVNSFLPEDHQRDGAFDGFSEFDEEDFYGGE